MTASLAYSREFDRLLGSPEIGVECAQRRSPKGGTAPKCSSEGFDLPIADECGPPCVTGQPRLHGGTVISESR